MKKIALKISRHFSALTTKGKKFFLYIRYYGWKITLQKVFGRYAAPYRFSPPSEQILKAQQKKSFSKEITFSILVPLYNTPLRFLNEMLQSVAAQTYGRWQLCLADGSDAAHNEVEKRCREWAEKDSRICYRRLSENGGISENTNACLAMAKGDYIALFDHDDLLEPSALFEMMQVVEAHSVVDAIYTDEDKVTLLEKKGREEKRYSDPNFKPDYCLDFLRSGNYICHFFAVRADIVKQVGGFCKEYDGSQDYDFILRCTENSHAVYHIPKVLYHWRISSSSTAQNPQNKLYCYTAGEKALEAHLRRQGLRGYVKMRPQYGFYRLYRQSALCPKITVLLYAQRPESELSQAIQAIKEHTSYPNYEILILSSPLWKKEKISEPEEHIHWISPTGETFFEQLEDAVRSFSGEYTVFLSGSLHITSPCWLEELLVHCEEKRVGAVGGKQLYRDGTIAHCGYILSKSALAISPFQNQPDEIISYFCRNVVTQNVSAISLGCMMIKTSVWEEIGGFLPEREQALTYYGDISFCLRLTEASYDIVLEPNVTATARNKKNKSVDFAGREAEKACLLQLWQERLSKGDRCYNPNFSDRIPYQ